MQRQRYNPVADEEVKAGQVLEVADTLPSMGRSGDVAEAYDRMAPIYDAFNAGNDYEHWLGEVLLPELEKRGLQKGAVLDIGCGTGRAFGPLLARGWHLVGCDVSIEMLDVAARGFPGVRTFQADARSLPPRPDARIQFRGLYDLALLLNDVVNYLTEDGDLERCFEGVARNLAPHGLVCFDANTLGLFEGSWVANGDHQAAKSNAPLEERGWGWRGLTEEARPGGIFEAEVAGDGIEGPSIHRERHWTPTQIEEALASCGLRCLALLGQREAEGRILLEEPLDEGVHYKAIYICGHADD